jgi:hypothetical protein
MAGLDKIEITRYNIDKTISKPLQVKADRAKSSYLVVDRDWLQGRPTPILSRD